MIDHIEYEAFNGLQNNLSSKFGYFWLLYLNEISCNVFISRIRLVSKSAKRKRVWCIEEFKVFKICAIRRI